MNNRASQLREQILHLAEQYYDEQFSPDSFVPGESTVPVSGKVLNGQDLRFLVDAALDAWLTTGRFAREFERRLAAFFWSSRLFAGELGLLANLQSPSRR